MKSFKTIMAAVAVLTLSASVALLAAPKAKHTSWKGSIAVTGQHSDADLARMAKITPAQADAAALRAVKAPAARKKVTARELEAENGSLVYSVEVTVQGKSGISEILVDAGNGKVLSRQHESPAAETKERAGEKGEAGQKGEK